MQAQLRELQIKEQDFIANKKNSKKKKRNNN